MLVSIFGNNISLGTHELYKFHFVYCPEDYIGYSIKNFVSEAFTSIHDSIYQFMDNMTLTFVDINNIYSFYNDQRKSKVIDFNPIMYEELE